MEWYSEFPVLIIDEEAGTAGMSGHTLEAIIDELKKRDLTILAAASLSEGKALFLAHPEISCVVIDWDTRSEPGTGGPEEVILAIHRRNRWIPVFLFTDKTSVQDLPVSVVRSLKGYFWKREDTPGFIAGHIHEIVERYLASLLPPFFGELVRYTEEANYSWHTPGHMGGVAFLKSPVGRLFFDFYGENSLRADLSVSVPGLGSLLDHSGVIGQAEANAARIFGSDWTWFVTNGTSSSNRIIFHATVRPGDIVLVDRNCHKSVMHAIIMTGAIPIYLRPCRNRYGIIGPIRISELAPETITDRIRTHPLIPRDSSPGIRHAVITNCTYDGICYSVNRIIRLLSGNVAGIHFDEAWYGYARFHPLYAGRYAMDGDANQPGDPVIYASQSIHKVLAAFSQASMIHVRDSHRPEKQRISPERFNEAYMMHSSTSPQYSILASLDVAAEMMDGDAGPVLMTETLEEATIFRAKMLQIGRQLVEEQAGDPWWFRIWQAEQDPSVVAAVSGRYGRVSAGEEEGSEDPFSCWDISPDDSWHGFDGIEEGYVRLDPTKVTILCPGPGEDGTLSEKGIPAPVVATYLREEGIVVEKTGFYSFLVLMTIGVTKGKTGSLISTLLTFKDLYDRNAPLAEVFPEALAGWRTRYPASMGLADLCDEMHAFLGEQEILRLLHDGYEPLPEQVMTPADAYRNLVSGNVENVPVSELDGRVAAVMVVPYPPGIPVIMPGERLTGESRVVIDLLSLYEAFDNRFPAYETGLHGVIVRRKHGQKRYLVPCIR